MTIFCLKFGITESIPAVVNLDFMYLLFIETKYARLYTSVYVTIKLKIEYLVMDLTVKNFT